MSTDKSLVHNPSLHQPSSDLKELERRNFLLHTIRSYFYKNHVLEVETPTLSSAANPDPNIESFATDYVMGSTAQRCFMHTSPEFFMKRLLATYARDIYFLGKVFRNGEIGRYHQPEFTMLEWYRVQKDHHQLMHDIEALLQHITPQVTNIQKVRYQALFEQYYRFNPHTISLTQLRSIVHQHISIDPLSLSYRDCLDVLFTHGIEPTLGDKTGATLQGVFVYDFPECMSSLAQVVYDETHKTKVAQRFELFINGIELANGYLELQDSSEQEQRFLAEIAQRKAKGAAQNPLDQRFLSALRKGLPSCAGVALGIDRLHMLLAGISDIRQVVSFDFERA